MGLRPKSDEFFFCEILVVVIFFMPSEVGGIFFLGIGVLLGHCGVNFEEFSPHDAISFSMCSIAFLSITLKSFLIEESAFVRG